MINVDPRSSTPIYEQVELSVKELIMKGIYKKGDKLPSVRELASTLTINPNTISKAYGGLERAGIIETIRGRGTFVSEEIERKVDNMAREKISRGLKKVILEASYSGITKDEFINLSLDIYAKLGVEDNDKRK